MITRNRKGGVSRRELLTGALTGLVVGFNITPQGILPQRMAQAAVPPKKDKVDANAFLRIAPDGAVTVIIGHSEMGQGIFTGLAMCIAEELGNDWTKMRSEPAPASMVYAHPAFHMQMTGGSSSQWSNFDRYRMVGATAREMLVQAAATRWKVAPSSCKVANGFVVNGSQKIGFGELAIDAMKLTPPASVKLKEPSEWTIVGKPMRRIDGMPKITGKATFGMDIQFPDLRTALVLRAPTFGSTLESFDPTAALAVPGVEKVVKVPSGVAVVAKHFWAAKLGRDALKTKWTAPPNGGVDTVRQMAEYKKLAQQAGPTNGKGDPDAALAKSKSKLVLDYSFPYLAHAPMEPLNCTVKITGDKCEIWTGTQFQGIDQAAAAKILGIPQEHVTVNTTFLGGGFGRRGNFASDFVSEGVEVAKAAGVPVKTVWTREDDLKGGYYRSSFVHHIEIGTDDKGNPVAWKHGVVGQSIMADTPMAGMMVKHDIDETSVEGLLESPYVENVRDRKVTLHSPKNAVPVLWWRSVGNTHTAFVLESAMDELAYAAKRDPLDYRLDLLKEKPRFHALLKACAEKAGWGKPLPAGHAQGLAIHESFGSIVAQVAEVSVDKGKIRVHKVTVFLDCGLAVNPMSVEAQLQGSVAFGLTAALYGAITLKDGAVEQSNFNDYPMLRIHEMPVIDAHIQASSAKMGGVGEPATAVIAPAVANAVFALTKRRLRTLPFKIEEGTAT